MFSIAFPSHPPRYRAIFEKQLRERADRNNRRREIKAGGGGGRDKGRRTENDDTAVGIAGIYVDVDEVARKMFEEAPRNRRCRALIADRSARGAKE